MYEVYYHALTKKLYMNKPIYLIKDINIFIRVIPLWVRKIRCQVLCILPSFFLIPILTDLEVKHQSIGAQISVNISSGGTSRGSL